MHAPDIQRYKAELRAAEHAERRAKEARLQCRDRIAQALSPIKPGDVVTHNLALEARFYTISRVHLSQWHEDMPMPTFIHYGHAILAGGKTSPTEQWLGDDVRPCCAPSHDRAPHADEDSRAAMPAL